MCLDGLTDANPMFDMTSNNSMFSCISRISSELEEETFESTADVQSRVVNNMNLRSNYNENTYVFAVKFPFR